MGQVFFGADLFYRLWIGEVCLDAVRFYGYLDTLGIVRQQERSLDAWRPFSMLQGSAGDDELDVDDIITHRVFATSKPLELVIEVPQLNFVRCFQVVLKAPSDSLYFPLALALPQLSG